MHFSDTQVIKESKDIQMSFDGTVARLSIKTARTEMSGVYKCQIVNEYGKEESSAELTIISKFILLQKNFLHSLVILFHIFFNF